MSDHKEIEIGDVFYKVLIDRETQLPFVTKCVVSGFTPAKKKILLTYTETAGQTVCKHLSRYLPPDNVDEAVAVFLEHLYSQFNRTKRTRDEKADIAKAAVRLLHDEDCEVASAEEPEAYEWI